VEKCTTALVFMDLPGQVATMVDLGSGLARGVEFVVEQEIEVPGERACDGADAGVGGKAGK
jgi:hypothetical protein